MFNSSTKSHYRNRKCAIYNGNDDLQFLNEFQEWLKLWKIVGAERQLPCVQGWLLNVSALQSIWKDLSQIFLIRIPTHS